jgi:Glyoxalase-like domain
LIYHHGFNFGLRQISAMPAIDNGIDHLVLAAPDLERACSAFESLTGVRPAFGGAHPGRGTHNALVSFDASCYLEIIAPDPAQTATSWHVGELTPLHWAVHVNGLASQLTMVRELGWITTRPMRMSRTPPDGPTLQWELCGLHRHAYGGVAPFLIDWLGSESPALRAPRVGPLLELELAAPEPTPLQRLLDALDVPARVRAGPLALGLRCAGPRGDVSFAAPAPPGFRLGD